MKEWRKKWYFDGLHVFYLVGMFLFLAVFYTRIHPLLVVDGDDWRYISVMREGLPVWGHWNPAKVFVETFVGFVGYFSAFVVYPVTKDYLFSFTLTYGILTAFFITVYLYCFDLMIIKRFKLKISSTLFVSFFFFCAHFLILKSQAENNVYMLSAFNLNCFCAYVWAFLLNACVGFCMVAFDLPKVFCVQGHELKKGLILAAIYLAIFSNMVDTIILFSVAFCCFFAECIGEWKKGKGKRYFQWKEWGLYLYIFVLQAVCMIFEANGGRADSLAFNAKKQIRQTVKDVKAIILSINRPYMILCILIVIAAIVVCIRRYGKKTASKELIEKAKAFRVLLLIYGASFVMCTVYILGLLTRMGQHKIRRSENLCVAFCYGAVLVAVCIAYLIREYEKTQILLPLVSFLLIFGMFGSTFYYTGNGHIYKRSHACGQSVLARKAIAQGIVDQFIAADEAGLDHVAVHVDTITGEQDWASTCWADTLYAHGIISRRMTAEVVPDPAIDEKFRFTDEK